MKTQVMAETLQQADEDAVQRHKQHGSRTIGDRILKALSLDSIHWSGRAKRATPSLALQMRDHNKIQKVEPIEASQVTPNDVIILLLGPTGSGKSTFIRTVTIIKNYDSGEVTHDMQSGTCEVSAVRVKFPDNQHVVLVDTPGLESRLWRDSEILEAVARWAEKIPGRKRRIAGVVYLHRISDVRMTGTMLTKFNVFQRLVGEQFFQHIVLTTTMWPEPTDQNYDQELERSEARESNLVADRWQLMIARGSTSQRFGRTPDSAWSIINYVIRVQSERLSRALAEGSSKRATARRLIQKTFRN